jgi:signal transduction histidine kinase/DNA-binding response OmpR family regulator/HAMP domain-containing protein
MLKRSSQKSLDADLQVLLASLKAYAAGEYSGKLPFDGTGVWGEIATTVNEMMMKLSEMSSEISRVMREVGVEGKLGGQANVPGGFGIWKELTDTVNAMSSNLAKQVRDIAKINMAVANGDLSRKVTADAHGEFLELKETVNMKVDRLNEFAIEVSRVAREVGTDGKLGGQANVPGASGVWKELTDHVNQLAANLTSQVRAIADVATTVTRGDLTRSIIVDAHGEVDDLKDTINGMIQNLRNSTIKSAEQDWLKSNLAKFTGLLQGHHDSKPIAEIVLSELAPLLNIAHGAFYIVDDAHGSEPRLKMLSAYATEFLGGPTKEWKIGEGLVGQCALEKREILLTDVPNDYIKIASGLGEAKPFNILLLPILFEGKIKAVMELASFAQYSEMQRSFLDQLCLSIGIVLNTVEASMLTEVLLKQSQSQTDELQSQQEELRATNQELEEKAQLLEEQKLEVEQAKKSVEEQATQLALTSKYKSEFLSNMSHELRTPLNSLLILAEQLAHNSKNHLDSKEVEFAKLIHLSGNELLSLINEILDLSKIESGTVLVDVDPVPFVEVRDSIEKTFRHVAQDRELEFKISLASDLPSLIHTDQMRLLQVVKNLIANAFKFTEKGTISLHIGRALSGWNTENTILNEADEVFAFTVNDTGIGISQDQQRIIFEAFHQGDGRTARKYGGTGLGLSISRELALLLGGELTLVGSVPQEGSTFALYLPQMNKRNLVSSEFHESEAGVSSVQQVQRDRSGIRLTETDDVKKVIVIDDRATIAEGDRVLLIIEDDPNFAKIILDLAREKGFKGIISLSGTQALALAHSMRVDAITLDIRIPDINGWTILDLLKRDPDLRHIPVDIITVEDDPIRALSQGAFQYVVKPASRMQIGEAMEMTQKFLNRPVKNLLLLTANRDEVKQITELLSESDVAIRHALGGKAGILEMGKIPIDCIVVGRKLTDMTSANFITLLRQNRQLGDIPVVMFSGTQLSDVERNEFEKLSAYSVVRSAESLDRLLDQTALFLHRVISRMPQKKQRLIQQLHQSTNNLGGKEVLIIDDDARNIIALTAALERRGAVVLSAGGGAEGIDLLNGAPGIALVLTDIMMPEMDGYETIKRIRAIDNFKKLPIIALTAKAMVGDREKCLEAGASDYLTKPVNIERLVSLMQVWLAK